MRALLSVCFVVLLAVLVVKAQDYPYPSDILFSADSYPSGLIGNNSFYVQHQEFFKLANIRNPLTVSITYSSGDNFPASVCFNSQQGSYPLTGINLNSNCPSGGYGEISNNTLPNGSSLPDAADESTDETVNMQVYVKPSASAGFIVTLPDAAAAQNFTLWFSGQQCDQPDQYPVGSNGQCIPIDTYNNTASNLQFMTSVGAGTWKYIKLVLPAFDSTVVNNITVSVNGTDNDISLFIQEGYYPTESWFLNTDNNMDIDDVTQATILTPGAEVYFIGLYNDGEQTYQVSVNTTVNKCSSSALLGYLCSNNATDPSSPVTGIRPIPATLTPNTTNSMTTNNGSSLRYDFSDDSYEHAYAYFMLTDYPTFPQVQSYIIRVSVGNNDVSSLDGAPAIYAKQGSVPSAQSNHYNASTVGDVVHQLLLPVDSNSPPWYIAVQLPVDFAIWVGPNCADDCDGQAHGTCDCNSYSCPTVTTDNAQYFYNTFYAIPHSLDDSGGACNCDDQRYAFSFDCSQKNNGNAALYILLIAIGGALVLCVAIVVPVYCGIANKKANSYDKI